MGDRKIIIVSHNDFAHGLKKAAEMITGQQNLLYSFGLQSGQTPSEVLEEIQPLISEEEEIIILADIIGGSMCNAVMELLVNQNVRLIGGANLPLLLTVLLDNGSSELQEIIDAARGAIDEVRLITINEEENNFF